MEPRRAGAAVEVASLSKSFVTAGRGLLGRRPVRRRLALDNVSLRVERGEVVAVVGPNGSGKSTLIRVLATLTTPDSGVARVFGADVVEDAPRVRRHINRVSVDAAFAKELSPWENLSFAARLYGDAGKDRRARTEEALSRLGLGRDSLDRPMKQLSRGQQQKVAIARSLLTSPSLLLMDEPTTGLDPRSKREVQGFVRALHADTVATVLVCTHDLDEAETLCSRVIMLDRGRVIADGSAAALRRRFGETAEATLENVFLRLTGKTFADERDADEPAAADQGEAVL